MKMQCKTWKMQELKRYHIKCFFQVKMIPASWLWFVVSTWLSLPPVFFLDSLVNDAFVYSGSAETFFQLSWLSSNGENFISWIELIPKDLHSIFRPEVSISLYLSTSSSEYMLICLLSFGKNSHNSDAYVITLFGLKAIALSISFLIGAPTPSIRPLPCPGSVNTDMIVRLCWIANFFLSNKHHICYGTD